MQTNEVTLELLDVDYAIEALEERLEMVAMADPSGSNNCNNVCCSSCQA